jgi:hypothetical protein
LSAATLVTSARAAIASTTFWSPVTTRALAIQYDLKETLAALSIEVRPAWLRAAVAVSWL